MSRVSRSSTASDGFVALMTVLIVGSISLTVALSLLIAGTDSQRWVLVQQQGASSRQVANACAEEALQQIQTSTSFTGTSSLTFGTASCTYVVTSTGTSTREIDISTSGLKTVKKLKLYVTIGVTAITVTSWQEII